MDVHPTHLGRRPLLAGAAGLVAGKLGGFTDSPRRGDGPMAVAGPRGRIITGVDAQGRSTVVQDGEAPAAARFARPGQVEAYTAWLLSDVPADLRDLSDPVATPYEKLDPPPDGRYVEIVTSQAGIEYPWHRTASLDVVVVPIWTRAAMLLRLTQLE